MIDEDGDELPRGEVGRLAVRGPTGCRYLPTNGRRNMCMDGWNITGDSFSMDEDGYLHFAARNDDMIISSGYNIAGPEVEAALLAHAPWRNVRWSASPTRIAAQSCRRMWCWPKGTPTDAQMVKLLQDHVKARIAPFKYPRTVVFFDALPKTATGKIQRFRLRDEAMSAFRQRLRRGQDRFCQGHVLWRLPGSRRDPGRAAAAYRRP